MEQGSFNEGIAPGGLREKADIKLLICYLLKKLDAPVSRSKINEILQDNYIANYFVINEAVSELVKNGRLICELENGEEVLTITQQAIFDVSQIEKSLPRSIREKAVNSAFRIFARDRAEREIKAEVTALDHGYHVSFTLEDVGTELLKLTVYVSDSSQIELVKKNFYNNAASIYSDIISSLAVE